MMGLMGLPLIENAGVKHGVVSVSLLGLAHFGALEGTCKLVFLFIWEVKSRRAEIIEIVALLLRQTAAPLDDPIKRGEVFDILGVHSFPFQRRRAVEGAPRYYLKAVRP